MTKKVNVSLACPNCGTLINIVGTMKVKPITVEHKGIVKDILQILVPPSIRNRIAITIEGNYAKLEWKGKFDKRKFGQVNGEVRGYGGRYIKGHWILPLAVFQTEGGK